ncbi:hypothetical protein ASZ90_011657 [hydrocarbon metagenome]|jgi:hypothetical protein|uniref:Uncharacterized protein n=1 Tax=hydrocarbon metagenome TaxID=938273 RepID=A0A0W8FCL2_9ZZZZ
MEDLLPLDTRDRGVMSDVKTNLGARVSSLKKHRKSEIERQEE